MRSQLDSGQRATRLWPRGAVALGVAAACAVLGMTRLSGQTAPAKGQEAKEAKGSRLPG